MGQNVPSSCRRSDFLDGLMASVTENWPHVGRLSNSVESKLNEYGSSIVRPYFLLYTLPVLEISGFLDSAKTTDRDLWASVQTMMGVHLRYLDNVIDADVERNVAIMHLLSSHRLLFEARSLLIDRGLEWRPCQDDIYGVAAHQKARFFDHTRVREELHYHHRRSAAEAQRFKLTR